MSSSDDTLETTADIRWSRSGEGVGGAKLVLEIQQRTLTLNLTTTQYNYASTVTYDAILLGHAKSLLYYRYSHMFLNPLISQVYYKTI